MKRILGLDLGTTSIGWALVNESDIENEKSSIVKTGVRVIPLTTDQENDFQKGKSITINSDRTLKRGARRNLHRYKMRRDALIKILTENRIISEGQVLTEDGTESTFETWKLRAQAAEKQISTEDFARVLLAINKKRGYKSNRRAKDEEDGKAVDGMEIAIRLQHEKLTPGQLVMQRFDKGRKSIPEFYRSDLQAEFDKIWDKQKDYYPDVLSDELKLELKGKNKQATWKICEIPFNISGIRFSEKGFELKKLQYQLRVLALNDKLDLERLAVVFQEINQQIYNSSGYLGKISDRSKQLILNDLTVGQYLYKQLKADPHNRLKNQVFYRKDYENEFDRIWSIQAKGRENIFNEELRVRIKKEIIFYQRRLKSQKGLISICELEGRKIEIEKNGIKRKKTVGPRVIPRSSPLFQEFKIWQILNNLKLYNTDRHTTYTISELDKDVEIRESLFEILNSGGKMTAKSVLKYIVDKPKEWKIDNYEYLEGNNTNEQIKKAFEKVLELSGHDPEKNYSKTDLIEVLHHLGINTEILNFDSDLEGKAFEKQPSYQFWHLMYSYEGDDSDTGDELLSKMLQKKFGFSVELVKPFLNIVFQDDYGSLSTRAIKKILPHLKAGHDYFEACQLAGYNHSHSETKEEREKRVLDDFLEILPKNSLRNPVVEKILNQMVNVVNAIFKEYGKPDEIRVELARELKKSAKERQETTRAINSANARHETLKKRTIRGLSI